jgi:hypothetical protein
VRGVVGGGAAAHAEGAVTRVVEYSFVEVPYRQYSITSLQQQLAIWVVSGATGELLCSKVVSLPRLGGSAERGIHWLLTEMRSSMNVLGRDAMSDAPDSVSESPGEPAELLDEPYSQSNATSSKEDVTSSDI